MSDPGIPEFEGNGAILDLDTIQTTGSTQFRGSQFLRALRNWGTENGLKGLEIRMQTVTPQGERMAEIAMRLINRMGDSGFLNRNGDMCQLYWLFAGE